MERQILPKISLVAFLCIAGTFDAGSLLSANQQAATTRDPCAPLKPEPGKPDKEDDRPKPIWCGANPQLSLRSIAELAAPILWFSPDEPLLRGENTDHPVPSRLPCDETGSRGSVVYYRVDELRPIKPATQQAPAGSTVDLGMLASVRLAFYFYYPWDIGYEGHEHDLESIEIDIGIRRDGSIYRLFIDTVKGFAHGVGWYSSILHTNRQTSFPITVLVEEGKHASCPDNNGDGIYTPGFDVNRHVKDAWGVRDTLGAGWLGPSAYSSAMTKRRQASDRVRVESVAQRPLFQYYRPGGGPEAITKTYALREIPSECKRRACELAPRLTPCAGHPTMPPRKPSFIDKLMVRERFYKEPYIGSQWIPVKAMLSLLGVSALKEVADGYPFSFRFDRRPGVSWVVFPARLEVRPTGGYVLPRLAASAGRLGVDALYADSAARPFGWYAAAGWEHQFQKVGERIPDRNRLGYEIGFRIRFKKFAFTGIRIGARAAGFSSLRDARLIVEVGGGLF